MANVASISEIEVREDEVTATPRHSLLVRVTHWVFTLSFLGLVASGYLIIMVLPRFYWGQTGGLEATPLFSLHFAPKLISRSGIFRSLHFQSAWVAVITGLVYVVSGLLTGHFRREMVPADLSWGTVREHLVSHLRLMNPEGDESYNVLQRITYLGVVFVLFPMILWTGLAMSPAVIAVFPWLVSILGGHQTARTLHFFLADMLVLFLVVHVGMVVLAGFADRMRGMTWGRAARPVAEPFAEPFARKDRS
jgi:thiosulfate reductase cytochrome b subunit